MRATGNRQCWIWLGLAIFFVAISVSYYRKVSDHPEGRRSAIFRWQQFMLELAQGEDIWELRRYPNPPIMALLLMPLAHLPYQVCALSWFYLKCVMAIVALHWIFRMLESGGPPFPLAGKVLAVLLGLRLLAGDLTHGNINLFIFFLLAAALFAYCHRHDFKSGLLLSLAIACKITPGLFVPYLIWKRAWQALAGCAGGLVLFFWLVPGLFLGMSENTGFLKSWADTMVRPYLVEGKVTTEYSNQSLPGLVYRLGSRSPSFFMETYTEVIPLEYHNFLDLDARALAWLVRACLGLFVLLVVWCCRTPASDRAGWPFLAEGGMVVLGMLLFSERTWKHHYVTLLLPLSVISYFLFACRPEKKLRALLVGALGLAFLLMTLTSTGLFPQHDRVGRLAQVYGAYVWANLLLLAALAAMLRFTLRENRRKVLRSTHEPGRVLSARLPNPLPQVDGQPSTDDNPSCPSLFSVK